MGLIYRIMDKVKEKFASNEARDIELWMVENHNICEDEFLNLVLDENNGVRELKEGEFNKFWTGQPLEGHTHVIINSPYLNTKQEMHELIEHLRIQVQALDPISISLQQLFDKQHIKQGDILFYERTYKGVKFEHQWEVKSIYDKKKLLVVHTLASNKEAKYNNLTEFELRIIKIDPRFKNIKRATGSAYDYFFRCNGENKQAFLS
ncbi:5000_t:CDS:2 [Ambispora gerdemannii]|uniref:5000_t:CDS:1 n=1 Tax=Ambispora gerdemannii TaxID=144530 RepID=A0A9N9BXQ5_9GLOM|nr:5000_t:CDS:2 [Ambispora gerdemannii]